MKTFYIYFLLCGLMIMGSCAGESTESDISILGEWKLKEYYYESSSVATQNDEVVNSSFQTVTGKKFDIDLIFSENKFESSGDISVEFVVETNGTINDPFSVTNYGFHGTGAYSINNEIILLKDQEFNYNFSGEISLFSSDEAYIEELTENKLIIRFQTYIQHSGSYEIEESAEGYQIYTR